MTRRFRAFRVQGGQALRQILGRGLGARLGAVPVRSAHFGELDRVILARADVFRHHVELRRRNVQTVRPGVADFDIVLHRAVHRHLYDAREPADAVIFVHHKVAHGEIGVGADLLAVGHGLVFRSSQAARSDLRIGEHRKLRVRVLHTGGDAPRRDETRARRGQRVGVLQRLRVHAAPVEEIP